MKNFFLAVCTLVLLLPLQAMSSGRDTYTVVVSLDGLRWDYLDAYDVPFFDHMARMGCKAVMSPSFPSKTFPNHYTLATGLTPDHHGIIANQFVDRATGRQFSLSEEETRSDPRYYGGDPVWLTAKRQGVVTATVFWVGSDVPVKGDYATYWHDYVTEKLTPQQRVDEVIGLLQKPEGERPHLVMAYFEEPDHSGHNHGPLSRPTRQAVEQMDSLMCVLWQRIQQLPIAPQVNLIVTGDHGMTSVSPLRAVPIHPALKDEWVSTVANDYPTLIYASQPQYIDSICQALQPLDHIRYWRRGELPAYLEYGENPNMGDVVVLPDVGWTFTDEPSQNAMGSHGFDHTAADMQVGFRALGPDFKQGYERPGRFRNVCLYPLLCHLLGVTPAPNDGSLDEVADMLR